jgi:hypothetical protein|tara:strand:+ start:741 stop:1292 length:552 start_codon:yes stop_codon:yes gene_type:complete
MIDALLKKHKQPFLRWWLLISIIVITFVGLYVTGIIDQVYSVDVTKLSFLIFGLMAFMSIKCGYDTYRLTATDIATEKDIDEIYATAELGWFTSDFCLTLGMIGTVAGFIFMLSTAFATIDVSNVNSLQNVLTQMSAGMGTALYTTAAGLVASAFLKLQYFNFSLEIDRLVTLSGIKHGRTER